MQRARRAIEFCYLCGQRLPAKGQRRNSLITREHVIPQIMLGPRPTAEQDRWSLILDVHQDCERVIKQGNDHILKLVQQMHIEPLEDWPKLEQLRALPMRRSVLYDPSTGMSVPTFTDCPGLFECVWTWVLGLHASLYGTFLNRDTWHLLFPPVKIGSSQIGGWTVKETEFQSSIIRDVLAHAEKIDKWDGISAWGSAVEYKCVWWRVPKEGLELKWLCYWTLLMPGVLEWSRRVQGVGDERPWHGYYACSEKPSQAALIRGCDLEPETRESCSVGRSSHTCC